MKKKSTMTALAILVVVILLSGCPISTVQELQKIGVDKRYPLDGEYYLTQDIDASGVILEPIGTMDKPFTGMFDGRGFAIKNLTIESDQNNIGLFGVLYNSYVCNLNIENAEVKGNFDVGILAGMNLGTIQNCVISGSVFADSWAGLLVGNNAGIISECVVQGKVRGTNSDCGGIVGGNAKGLIEKSTANIFVSVLQWGGGVAGMSTGGIDSCVSSGQVNTTQFGGGIVGELQWPDSFVRCSTSTVEVNCPLDYGEIVGNYADNAPLAYCD